MRCDIMEFISAQDAAKKWGISQRRVATLCSGGRVEGAKIIGNMWLIPINSEKPLDGRTVRFEPDISLPIKPLVKWAGGKGQLLNEIRKHYPAELGNEIRKYAEPFIGGGAVLFDILSKYELDKVYLSDTNKELVNCYIAVRDYPSQLIDLLNKFQSEYIQLSEEDKKSYYYYKREKFNSLKALGYDFVSVELAALFIFLNKTCFNGLFRVNSKGSFNVPMGHYKNPLICDSNNINNVSKRIQNTIIIHGDFKKSDDFIDQNTFAYFDPPYRPLTESSSFTSYTEAPFNDEDQKGLADYVTLLSRKGAKIMISNSDPKNSNPNDDFFDSLYSDFNIFRINANRMINSKGSARGKISELLITNYSV